MHAAISILKALNCVGKTDLFFTVPMPPVNSVWLLKCSLIVCVTYIVFHRQFRREKKNGRFA